MAQPWLLAPRSHETWGRERENQGPAAQPTVRVSQSSLIGHQHPDTQKLSIEQLTISLVQQMSHSHETSWQARERRGEITENTISPDKYFNLLSLSLGARRVGGNWEGHVSLAMWVSTLED